MKGLISKEAVVPSIGGEVKNENLISSKLIAVITVEPTDKTSFVYSCM